MDEPIAGDSMEIIKLNNINKHFNFDSVLKDVNVNMGAGQFCALLGPNGAGKSTLLNILGGLQYADSGTGHILDQPFSYDLGEVQSKIGMVSEHISFDLPCSVQEFVELYSKTFKQWDWDLFRQYVKCRDMDLSRPFYTYSRGQKMQIVLMATLSYRPKILLVDEITSVLDVHARKYFIEELNAFVKDGGLVVMTTNIVNELQFHATRAMIIYQGRILWDNSMEEASEHFIKLRQTKETIDHPMFSHPQCFWVGMNSDLSHSFLIPRTSLSEERPSKEIVDKRKITLEEVYMYFIESMMKE